jgi:peroxiredoxin
MMRFLLMVSAAAVLSFNAFAGVTSGAAAPEFSLQGSDGKTYKLSDFKGKIVVLEWFNKDCPFVRKFYTSKTMQGLQKDWTGKGVVWFTVSSAAEGKEGFMKPDENNKYRTENTVASTATLLDTTGKVGKLYGAKTTPHMFVINKDGKVAYQGAIDDKPSANPKELAGATNYVTAALTALTTDGKASAIKVSSTTPYGCSVKY